MIYYSRVGKDLDIYTEGFVRDDGVRLDTRSIPPREFTLRWSRRLAENGLLKPGQVVYTLQKHHFYREWFGILELLDEADGILGYYCDILTPLRKENGLYYLHDLLLDLWISPDGSYQELDWDEYHEAVHQHRLTEEQAGQAVKTMRWLVGETQSGRFPADFLIG